MHKNVVSSYKHVQNCTILFSFKDNMRRKGKTDFFSKFQAFKYLKKLIIKHLHFMLEKQRCAENFYSYM